MEYAAPRLRLPSGLEAKPATSEWWVVAALALVLLWFASIGIWCWLVCNGHVQSCSADFWHMTAVAHCYY